MHVKVNHHLWSVLNRKSRPQISKSTKDLLDLKMSSISSRIRIDHWNVVGNGLHSVSSEKQEKRTRNKDRPDRGVWTPLRRSDGSHASDESLSSPASQSTQLQPDSAEEGFQYYNFTDFRILGSHGEVKYDLSNARSGEFKTVGTGCSGYHSLDNGSHKHGGCRGLAHNVKDLDGSSIVSEGKLLKKGGSSGYGSHEVNKCGFRSHVLVLNVVLTGVFANLRSKKQISFARPWRNSSSMSYAVSEFLFIARGIWAFFVIGNRVCVEGQSWGPAFGAAANGKPEADVVVIGSGIAGLCCAGLLSRYQQDVLVLESHSLPGGAAHSFEKKGYKFDSGPSLFSGFQSRGPQANPLAQVSQFLVPIMTLGCIGPTEFFKDLEKYASLDAAREWRKLLASIVMQYCQCLQLQWLCHLYLFEVIGVFYPLLQLDMPPLLKSFAQMGPQEALRVKSNGILSAEMVYMFAEWYKPDCSLEYPIHGTGAVVDALVRGLQKFGGRISFNSHVEIIVVENGRAVGVKLRSGQVLYALRIVSNASMWDTLDLLPKEVIPNRIKMTPQCESFMHLHLGFDAEGISEDLKIHHIVVNDWERGVDADQNVVLISIPSVLSPDLAAPGKHVLHAYMPGTKPFGLWEGLDRKSAEYKELKAKRSESNDECYLLRVLWHGVESRESASPQKCGGKAAYLLSLPNPIVLWRAMERAVGLGFDHEKCEVKLVGTPLTHQRFLRRNRGTYGPAIQAGKGTFPGHSTPIPQLYCCGDSTFPGIGVPAVAASGAIVANSLVSVSQHSELLDAVGI
ncbi:unnamed protein product [Camellia sinensis]